MGALVSKCISLETLDLNDNGVPDSQELLQYITETIRVKEDNAKKEKLRSLLKRIR